ncbi:MAG: protein-L-isoaspartate(D-aspartate) O-methyltransferase [Bacteroidia bacterium]|nr:protein-L-isoaspartate(D-aspartate) O-methyltransferase [Bacteroidia bacterium]
MHNYQDTYRHKGQRRQLRTILEGKGIQDPVILNAIESIPRHFFLPLEFDSHAYEDKAFPIAAGQTISQPYTVAYQTRLLKVNIADKVLEIGTGSGYQAAVLSLCGADVYTIERHQELSENAAQTLRSIGLNDKIKLFVGDGTRGLSEYAPYDAILVTAGAPSVPKALVAQLKVGGRLVIPVGKSSEMQRMVRITKINDKEIQTEAFDDFSFVPLVGENGWKLND